MIPIAQEHDDFRVILSLVWRVGVVYDDWSSQAIHVLAGRVRVAGEMSANIQNKRHTKVLTTSKCQDPQARARKSASVSMSKLMPTYSKCISVAGARNDWALCNHGSAIVCIVALL
jgi:hypothetical protein